MSVAKLKKAAERFRDDPALFVRSMMRVEPDDNQTAIMAAVARGDRGVAVKSGHGVGKALRWDEPVLTPGGWVPIAELSEGDAVVAGDGSITTVVGVFPQGERALHRVTMDDGGSVVTDAEHQWFTTTRSERKHGRPGGVRTTSEIAASLTFPNGRRRGLNHRIPTAGVVQHPIDPLLPMDPYALGVWLGDGSADGRITSGDPEVFAVLEQGGASIGAMWRDPRSTAVSAGIGLRAELRALGLLGLRSHEKWIPRRYLHASPEQREMLLQGLMDTDGTVGAHNNALTFSSVSPHLADDMAELVRSLGGVARRSSRIGKYGGKTCRRSYRLYLALPEPIAPFRLARKSVVYAPRFDHHNRVRTLGRFVRSVEPAGRGDAVCIAVAHPSSLYVTRDHIVTHNTSTLSWLSIWWITVFPDAKVRITAPTAAQLDDTLLPEMKMWLRRMPSETYDNLYHVKADKIEFKPAPERNFISAVTSRADQPDAMQGVHAEHVLLIADEASGVPDQVFEASIGSMSAHHATMILAGNPVRNKGFFYDCFTKPGIMEKWTTFTVSCVDHPRISAEFIEEQKERYGEDSNAFRIRVLGEFPRGDDDAVIPMYLIQAATDRDVQPVGSVVWGIDVARFGTDKSTLAKRRGNALLEPIRKWAGLDTMQLSSAIKQEWDVTPMNVRPYDICVDVIGVGAGVVDRLRELKLPARGINVSESPAMGDRYANLRSELWYRVREWLEARDCTMPRDEDLAADLAMPSYRFLPSGKIMVQPKATRLDGEYKGMKRSPNCGDALAMTFASTATSLAHGSRFSRDQPIKRKIPGLV